MKSFIIRLWCLRKKNESHFSALVRNFPQFTSKKNFFVNTGIKLYTVKDGEILFLVCRHNDDISKEGKIYHWTGGKIKFHIDRDIKISALRELNEETYNGFKDQIETIKSQLVDENEITLKKFCGYVVRVEHVEVEELKKE